MKKSILLLLTFIVFTVTQAQPTITSFSPLSGAVGETVTITGTNLSTPTVLTIGGVSAIPISNDGTTLVAMIMPGATTGDIEITTSNGSTTSAANFTIVASVPPAFQQGKLVGTGVVGDYSLQGTSVAISADGSTAIVGGYYDNSGQGAVWVYTRSGSTWSQQGDKLVGTGSVGDPDQGRSVSLSADGNTVIVGGSGDNENMGAVWVFIRSGGVWSQQGDKLVGTGAIGTYVRQGHRVSLSADGNTAMVGGHTDNNGQGAVWIFTRSGSTWSQQGDKLVGTGNIGTSVYQGYSVSLSADGNTAMVGGYNDNNGQGAVWVFTRSAGVWSQQGAKIVGTGNIGPAYQGRSVSLSADGNTAVFGGPEDNTSMGAAWVFTRNTGVWSQQGAKIVGTGGVDNPNFGISVSLSADGNTAVFGGPEDNSSMGAAWVFTRNTGIWSQQGAKIVGTGGIDTPSLGESVNLSANGNYAILGGPYDDQSIDDGIGAAWVFNGALEVSTVPTITSFSPLSGAVGETVTITGTSFNTTAANNVVFFGATQATVSASTATSITVTVPIGSQYHPITALNTSSGLAASSRLSFNPIINPFKSTIESGDFDAKINLPGTLHPSDIELSDIDGDGKADIVTVNQGHNGATGTTVSVFRNTGSSGTISFATKEDFTVGNQPIMVSVGDIDGDGKPDVVSANQSSGNFSVLLNTSSVGSLSFNPKVDIANTGGTIAITLGDVDGDGRPDVITGFQGSPNVAIFRNTSSLGSVSFAAPVILTPPNGSASYDVKLGDLDGDGKADIAMANINVGSVTVFRSTSTSGSISFAAGVNYTVAGQARAISMGDIDGDGKIDIACANYASYHGVSVLRNTSTLGSINFDTKVDFPTTDWSASINMGDINGDGKPDILIGHGQGAPNLDILPNTSSIGAVSFATKVVLQGPSGNVYGVVIGDLDGDEKSDVACCNQFFARGVDVYRYNPIIPNTVSTASSTPTLCINTVLTAITHTTAGATGISNNGVSGANGLPAGVSAAWSSNTITISGTPTASGTFNYSIALTGGNGSVNATGTITVDPANTVGVASSTPTLCLNTALTAITHTTAGATGISNDGVSGSNGLPAGVSAAWASNTITISGTPTTSGTFNYNIPLTGSCGSVNATGIITVNPAPSNQTVSPTSQTLCYGSSAQISISSSEIGFNYFLRDDSDNIVIDGPKVGTGAAISFSTGNLAASKTYNIYASPSTVAVDFKGTGRVTITGLDISPSVKPILTAEAWINLTTTSGLNTIIGNDNGGYDRGMVIWDGFYHIFAGRDINTGIVANTNVWEHVAISWTASSITMYINGVNVYSTSGESINPGPTNTYISGVYAVDGKIDELRLWSTERTEMEISSNKDISLNGTESGLIAYYKFEDGTGSSTLSDATTNNYNGTLTGIDPATCWVPGVSIGADCAIQMATTATVTVSPEFTSGAIETTGENICLNGDPTSIGSSTVASGGDETITYKWESSTDDFATAGLVISGAVAASYDPPTGLQATTSYRRYAKDGTCNTTFEVSTGTWKVTVLLAPTISSFSPLSGAVGALVTITGTNFNTTVANNVVFFGATQATVSASTATSITVTVPTGASYAPITVLNTATTLAAYSLANFTSTFTPNLGYITSNDIAPKVDFPTGDQPYSVAIGDIDGDGKPDLAVANINSNTVSVLLNTGSSGSPSFAAKEDFGVGTSPISVAIGDIDGDGKPDLALANNGSNDVSVLRNTSSSGTLSFATKVDFTSSGQPRLVTIGDIDGDGKPDLAVAAWLKVSVLRNTCSSGTISFADKVDFTAGTNPYSIAIGDIDGDGKPDLAVANHTSNTISILRNTGSSGTLSFASSVDFGVGTNPYSVAIGDIDGDGKPDLAVANYSILSANVSVLRNTSSSGTPSFASSVDFGVGINPYSIAIGDIDGDGKPDLAIANIGSNKVSVFRNTGSSGSISFASTVDFTTGTYPRSVAIGDMDGDGKLDLVLPNSGSANVSVLRNTPIFCTNPTLAGTIATDQTICYEGTPSTFTSSSLPTGHTGTLEYKWQSSTTSASAGFTDIASSNASTYTAGVLSETTWFKRLARVDCESDWSGAVSSNAVKVTVYPEFIVGSISDDQSICYNTTPDLLTGVAPTGGNTTYTYQWKSSTDGTTFINIDGATNLNYQPAALTATTYYQLVQSTASGCGEETTNDVTITVYPEFVVGSISGNQTICYNTTPDLLLGIAPTGGNTTYTYQWKSSNDGTTFANIDGATNLNYQPAALTATTYYQLVQSSASGCGEETTNDVTITVYPDFVVGSISGNQTICYNTTPDLLLGIAPTGGNTTYTYQWKSSNDGTTFANIAGATNLHYQPAALTATTYYQLVQSSTSGCGEETTNDVTITVYPEFIVGSISGNQSICYNTTPDLLTGVAPTGGNTTYTFQWKSSTDGTTFENIDGATNLNYQPGTLTTTTYYQLVQSSSCGDETTNIVTITVYDDFVVGSISDNQSICYNSTPDLLIGVAPSGGNSPYAYQWQSSTDGTTFSDISGAMSLNYQPPTLTSDTYYQLVQSSTSGCGEETTNVIAITLTSPPTVSAGDDAAICEDVPHTLNGIASNQQSVVWTTAGDGSFDDATLLNATYTPGSGDVNNSSVVLTLTAFAISPCGVDAIDNMTLEVQGLPLANAGINATICENESYALSGTATNMISVLWGTNGDGSFDDEFILNPVYTPGPNDILDEEVTLYLFAYGASPCGGYDGDLMQLSINSNPDQPELPDGPIVIYPYTPSTEYYTNQISNATTYHWYLEPAEAGTIEGNEIVGTVNWDADFDYDSAYIHVIAINDCGEVSSETLAVWVDGFTGVNNINNQPEITIAPNPSTGRFKISIEGASDEVDLVIINSSGQVILKKKLINTINSYSYDEDISEEYPGIYYLKFITNSGVINKKVIIGK